MKIRIIESDGRFSSQTKILWKWCNFYAPWDESEIFPYTYESLKDARDFLDSYIKSLTLGRKKFTTVWEQNV